MSPTPISLQEFHAGSPVALDRCYRDHFDDVHRAVGRVLGGVDQENVVHHVFYRLVADAHLRESFHGGNLAAWLSTVSRNAALDYRRQNVRSEARTAEAVDVEALASPAQTVDARLVLERFLRDALPEKWKPVFEARFLRELSQREAALELGIERTTLAYQEQQIRAALRAFVLEDV